MSTGEWVNLVVNLISLGLLVSVLSVKRETRRLLKIIKEWADLIQSRDVSAGLNTSRVEQKADRLAVAVNRVPEATANKVVEKITEAGGGISSDSLKVVRPPEGTP